MERRSRSAAALLLGALLALGAVAPAAGEEKRHSVKNAAKEAWKAGAAKTKRTAKAGARTTKKAARGE